MFRASWLRFQLPLNAGAKTPGCAWTTRVPRTPCDMHTYTWMSSVRFPTPPVLISSNHPLLALRLAWLARSWIDPQERLQWPQSKLTDDDVDAQLTAKSCRLRRQANVGVHEAVARQSFISLSHFHLRSHSLRIPTVTVNNCQQLSSSACSLGVTRLTSCVHPQGLDMPASATSHLD